MRCLWEGLKHEVPVGGAQTRGACGRGSNIHYYSSLLPDQASKRGARLEDAQCFQKFLGDYRLVTIKWLCFDPTAIM